MKRRLALLMVLTLIISTFVPMNVFAGSDNSVDSTPSVADDATFYTTSTIASNVPVLRLEEDNAGEWGTGAQYITLELNNADWVPFTDAVAPFGTEDAGYTYYSTAQTSNSIAYSISGAGNAVTINSITRLTDSKIGLSFTAAGSTTVPAVLGIRLAAEMTGSGEATVKVDDRDSKVTGGTYTFANGAGGDTVVTVSSTSTFASTDTLDPIEIDELRAGTINDGNGEVKMRLVDSDFEWDYDFSGGTIAVADQALVNATVALSAGFNGTKGVTALALNTAKSTDRELVFNYVTGNGTIVGQTVTAGTTNKSTVTRGTITFDGLKIKSTSDASEGDVEMKVTGDDITAQTVVIGTYSDYEVAVTASGDIPTLYAGMLDESFDDTAITSYTEGANEVAIIKIKESVGATWLFDRRTEITFPDWVQVLNVDVDDSDSLTAATVITDIQKDIDGEGNTVEFTLTGTGYDNSAEDLNLLFYVSIESQAKGDLEVTVGGKSLGEDFDLVVADVVNPFEVTTEASDLKLGYQDQPVGDIVIKEVVPQMFQEGAYVWVTLEDGMTWEDAPTVEVTQGDVEINTDSVDLYVGDTILGFKIDSDSTEASTITISGGTITLDRTLPEGEFNVKVGGPAMVMNGDDYTPGGTLYNSTVSTYTVGSDVGKFSSEYAAEEVYVRIITPADANVKASQTVTFTIDAMEYKVGDMVMTSDVAPFIDANNRTMLPLRAFAHALGVTDANILWNDAAHSVTIFKGDRVVKVVIGEMSYSVNGTMVPMDTMAVIKDGRTFLPVRALGQALGAMIEWDPATRTVTIK